jgi:hypothetical protein
MTIAPKRQKWKKEMKGKKKCKKEAKRDDTGTTEPIAANIPLEFSPKNLLHHLCHLPRFKSRLGGEKRDTQSDKGGRGKKRDRDRDRESRSEAVPWWSANSRWPPKDKHPTNQNCSQLTYTFLICRVVIFCVVERRRRRCTCDER